MKKLIVAALLVVLSTPCWGLIEENVPVAGMAAANLTKVSNDYYHLARKYLETKTFVELDNTQKADVRDRFNAIASEILTNYNLLYTAHTATTVIEIPGE